MMASDKEDELCLVMTKRIQYCFDNLSSCPCLVASQPGLSYQAHHLESLRWGSQLVVKQS